jgi:hypothetical protein
MLINNNKQYKQEVLFDGCKLFYKDRSKIEITLVEHVSAGVVEVIGYDLLAKDESPRLYVDANALVNKFSNDLISNRLQEYINAHKIAINSTANVNNIGAPSSNVSNTCTTKKNDNNHLLRIRSEVLKELKKEYLLTRIQLEDCPGGSKGARYVVLTPCFYDKVDVETGLLDLQCMKPVDVIPAQVKRSTM